MANFFSRPELTDLQFKQHSGDTLNLSGSTKFRSISGLTLSDGIGGDIVVTASGASTATTQLHVLTYIDGSIKLQPSSVSGGTLPFLCGNDTITRFAQDPQYNVNVSANTVNDFLENFFFPSVPPSSSLSIASGGVSREFGAAVYGNLCYEAIRETNPINLVAVNDNAVSGYNNIILSSCIAGDCCDIVPYTYDGSCPIPPTGTSQTSVSYGVCVETICSEVSTTPASISWKNKKYYFQSSILYTAADALTLQNIATGLTGAQAVLSISKSANLSLTFSNKFFYYMYPTSPAPPIGLFGLPSFTVNGLPNNAWGNASTGTLFKIAYTNSNGYINEYYVARSDSKITGTFTIVIT